MIMPWQHDDGGRSANGFKGSTGDCACRAISIATGMNYADAYQLIIEYGQRERPRRGKSRSHPRTGVWSQTMRRIMADLGWKWVPTMTIGSGTTVHVRRDELPVEGRYILRLSGHFCALVDGVLRDTHDPSRDGTRAVYGYWEVTA